MTRILHNQQSLWLPDLMREAMQKGGAFVEDADFVGCAIEGPAVLMIAGGVHFQGCDMGLHGGDVRNLLITSLGPKIVGAVPVRNCRFESCRFHAVGFAGDAQFQREFQAMLNAPFGIQP